MKVVLCVRLVDGAQRRIVFFVICNVAAVIKTEYIYHGRCIKQDVSSFVLSKLRVHTIEPYMR